jgi:hypothetical protein
VLEPSLNLLTNLATHRPGQLFVDGSEVTCNTSDLSETALAMTELSCCNTAVALQELVESIMISLDHVENIDVGYPSSSFVKVDTSTSVSANDLCVIIPASKRVEPGGDVRFRVGLRASEDSDSCTAAAIEGVSRIIHAQIELSRSSLTAKIAYSVAISDTGDSADFAAGRRAPDCCIDLVVSVPEDVAQGSEVVLRRVSVAGFDVALGEAHLRVIVGFNHAPAPAGRVYAAAQAGDLLALRQALDDGHSTQESDWVSVSKRGCCPIARVASALKQ